LTNDLDSRIASLEARRRTNNLATARDAEQVVGELHEAVRQASLSVGGLNARTYLIDERASALEQRIRSLWVLVLSGVAATLVATIFIAAFIFWSAARVKAAAENEASFLREAYSVEIAASRRDGETALAELQSNLVRQREKAAEQLAEIGADLAAMSQDRDTVRQELENFIALRDRVGIELLDFRGYTLVVVPEGARIRRWQADDLSEVAHLNGRMYRLSD
jgi:DNA repair exonuclease SbcCD ATPase subunit